ncbi:MAG: hypothetical protein OXO54_10575 [Chloroflexota bacterium]|nr:hypothetical protein [Chloroflexota bacterium]MDE2898754.1 hypothetical protein [Chloroflexota bacterium]
MAVFDTLRAARTLKAAGFGDAKAEAVAEIVQAVANGNRVSKADMQGFATKADFERFVSTLDLERFTTKADLERFAMTLHLERFATKADFEQFATKEDLKPLVTRAELKSELQELELRLTIRMGVLAVSAVTIGVALMVALNQLLL